jgi:plastocyanin
MIIQSLCSLLLFSSSALAATISFEIKNSANAQELVSDAVVIADPLPAKTIPAPSGKVYVLTQQNKKFSPFVLPIEVGAKVRFPNLDDFAHSVYAVSSIKSFELPLYKKSDKEPPPVLFEKAGKVVLGCNIHDAMIGYILVLPTPYFSSSKEGKASLNLPAGQYQIRSWHPRMKEKDPIVVLANIQVQNDSSQSISLTLQEDKTKSNPFAPNGGSYGK